MIRSEALILKRIRHGETSLIVHAFTREHGRISFIAKGARSGGKRAVVPLVPVVLLELIWKQSSKSEIQVLREVSLVNGFGIIPRPFTAGAKIIGLYPVSLSHIAVNATE